jgi:RHS repeat-associated protein
MAVFVDGAMINSSSASYYRARYYDPATGRFISEDPIQYWGGNNFFRYVHNSPANFTDPFGLTDYNEQQTQQLFLQQAYKDATAGYFKGLWNIRNHSTGGGDFDFAHNEHAADTFTRCGIKMSAGDFGNYIAGFQSGAWDDAYYGDREIGFSLKHLYQLRYAEAIARGAGVFYHLKGDTDVQNDRWDRTGMPWITLGADDGRIFSNRGGGCGCSK